MNTFIAQYMLLVLKRTKLMLLDIKSTKHWLLCFLANSILGYYFLYLLYCGIFITPPTSISFNLTAKFELLFICVFLNLKTRYFVLLLPESLMFGFF